MEVPFQISNLVKISFFQYITDCRTQKEKSEWIKGAYLQIGKGEDAMDDMVKKEQ